MLWYNLSSHVVFKRILKEYNHVAKFSSIMLALHPVYILTRVHAVFLEFTVCVFAIWVFLFLFFFYFLAPACWAVAYTSSLSLLLLLIANKVSSLSIFQCCI